MKIIFSPAKDMDFSKKSENKNICISNKTEKIINIINSLSKDELKKTFKVNDNILDNIIFFYKNIKSGPFYEGLNLYNGFSFKQVNKDFSQREKEYLNNHLLILSSLYGPIKAQDLISPYRLDMNTNIKIDKMNLKKYWKEDYNKAINEDEIVFNLASDEFSSLFNREKFKFIDFDFYKIKDDKLKSHSTTSKKGRGILLNHLIHNRIETVDDLLVQKIKGLKLYEVNNEKIIYILEE